MRRIKHNEVVRFIKNRLVDKLERDFRGRPFRMFRERDLHACAYHHLRSFLDGDHRWFVLNDPHLRHLVAKGKHAKPDLVLFDATRAKIVVELKFKHTESGIQTKDRRVLRKVVNQSAWAKKAFYIETVIQPKTFNSKHVLRYRNKSISIHMRPDRVEEFWSLYERYRKPAPHRRRAT